MSNQNCTGKFNLEACVIEFLEWKPLTEENIKLTPEQPGVYAIALDKNDNRKFNCVSENNIYYGMSSKRTLKIRLTELFRRLAGNEKSPHGGANRIIRSLGDDIAKKYLEDRKFYFSYNLCQTEKKDVTEIHRNKPLDSFASKIIQCGVIEHAEYIAIANHLKQHGEPPEFNGKIDGNKCILY